MSDFFSYQKRKRDVGLPYNPFQDTEVRVVGYMPTQQQQSQEIGPNHIKRDPNFLTIDNIAEMSEHVVNTERVTIYDKGMSHKEGGWAYGIDPTEPEMTTKWRKKTEKEPVFIGAVKNLVGSIDKCIMQNNQIDLFEEYFYKEEAEKYVENLSTKTVSLFKDPGPIKRSVSKISWNPDSPTRIAVSYAMMRFQQMPDDMPMLSYVWDLTNPNEPSNKLKSNSPLTCISFNHKNPDQLGGGCYNGIVGVWDLRDKDRNPVVSSKFSPAETSHWDPVSDLVWLTSRTNSEFVTTSTDGKILWWDARNMSAPTEGFTLSEGPIGPEGRERIVGGTCIEYVTEAGPNKYLVGTEQGSILTVNKKSKKPIDIAPRFGIDHTRHFGPVTSIRRNPIHNKFFMSIGDWSVKIWNDDAKTLIIRTRYHNAYLSDGCWSPTRPGLFFVTRRDGWLDAWDYHYRQNEIGFSHKVSDSPLTCMKIYINSQGAGLGNPNLRDGQLAAVGDQEGTVTLLELCDSLYLGSIQEKDSILEMLDRETKKEKNLEAIKKAAENKARNQRESKAPTNVEEKKAEAVRVCEEAFFAKIGKGEAQPQIDDGDKSDEEDKAEKKVVQTKPVEQKPDQQPQQPKEDKPKSEPKLDQKPDEKKDDSKTDDKLNKSQEKVGDDKKEPVVQQPKPEENTQAQQQQQQPTEQSGEK